MRLLLAGVRKVPLAKGASVGVWALAKVAKPKASRAARTPMALLPSPSGVAVPMVETTPNGRVGVVKMANLAPQALPKELPSKVVARRVHQHRIPTRPLSQVG
jgi:hypothetical protein